MNEITTTKITLDFYNKNIVSVSAKQYDSQSRYIEISCTENGKAFAADKNTMSAYIRYQKPDGTGCFNDCEITDEGNILTELTEQMLSVPGKAEADIMLLKKVFASGGKPTDIEDIYEMHAPVISAMSFYINIAPTALNHAQIESSYEFNALTSLISKTAYNNEKAEALDKELTENENERKTAEADRVNSENSRKSAESARVNAENSRKSAETERVNNENTRKNNEAARQTNEETRQAQENERQTDTDAAVESANQAAQNASDKANDLQNKLDTHHFVLTEDKDVAGGVAGLDTNKKILRSVLPVAGTALGAVKSGTDITVDNSGNVSVNDNSHKHIVSNISDLTVTATELNYVDGVTDNIQNQLNTKANIASPEFTGVPKAPTAAAGTSTTQLATTKFVQHAVSSGIAASDAMIIKGTIGTSGTVTALPTTYKTGWTYRVTSAGTYAGQVCEIGDLIIALIDRNGSGNANSDWCVAQTNINGAITGVKSGDAYIQTSQTGSVVTITHKDVASTNTTSSVSPAHGGKFTTVKTVTRDTKGHITGVDTQTVTLPDAVASTSLNGLMSSADKLKLNYTNIAYGTCETDGATSEKIINISGNNSWDLQKGSIIIVKFTNTNTASSVTLNINNTGAKSIWAGNAVYTGTSSQYCGYANRNLVYAFDGTYWVWLFGGYDANTTYSNATLGQGYGNCTTAEAATAKVVTLLGYNLVVGGIVAVKFTYAVPANATMNINNRGAKAIYYRGTAITSGVINADDIGVFIYNGTQYHLFSVDRNNSSQTVGNGTITITQNGTTKGTFTTNQSGNATIALTDNNTTYSTGTATASGITKLYTATGSATDGTMTQSAITSALNGKAASSHTHSYIPLSGSSAITGNLTSSTNAQKNLGDRTHAWNEVWAKSVNVTGSYADDESYGIAYTDNDDVSGLVIGNLDDTEGGNNSNWIIVTDDCKMCNNLNVEGSLSGTGVTNFTTNLMKKIYPVGSIYISTVSTAPSTLFGFGTWTQIKDTFLLAAGNTYTAGSTGGEATHKLTVNEIPAHTHSVSFTTTSGASNMTGAFAGSNGNSIGNTTATTTQTGGSAAHNNMPPYLTVYMWKRTA